MRCARLNKVTKAFGKLRIQTVSLEVVLIV
jgi:hypothetical protein